VTGYTSAHQALEEYLAAGLKREKVLLFNSGFAANQAVCQALFSQSPTKSHDLIIADKLMHASFIDGAQASGVKLARFKHNDLRHLDKMLSSADDFVNNVLVATESVFSMDGDQAPLRQIVPLTEQTKAWLMVDDAHGFGVLGQHGIGVIEAHNLSQQQVPIVMATFGKAIGTAGAFVAGSADFIDYLINFARHYIYSTAMPAAQAYATLMSLQSKQISQCRAVLSERINLFKVLAEHAGLKLMPSETAIQPVHIGNAAQALAASQKLKELGLWVTAIRYPTVPKHTDRLRVTLTAGHEERDIHALIDALQIVLNAQPQNKMMK
jgi:8-amino-7-oxononanoate synthase